MSNIKNIAKSIENNKVPYNKIKALAIGFSCGDTDDSREAYNACLKRLKKKWGQKKLDEFIKQYPFT